MELEQMLEHTPIRATDSGAYNTIDTYAQDTVPLYGSNVFDKPIGGIGSGFSPGSPGNIRRTVADCLQERYDLSGHGGSEPHINYDLIGASHRFSSKSLGDAHTIKLFNEGDK